MPGDVSTLDNSKSLAREVGRFLNNVRKDPKILIPIIEDDLQYFEGDTMWKPNEIGMRTNEGPGAWVDAVQFLKQAQPMPELDWNAALEAAAIDHAYDIGPQGRNDHTGSDGSTMTKRIERHGTWKNFIGENINVGAHTAEQIVKALVIDDGVPGRGHRKNIFSPNFTVIGIGCSPHKDYTTCTVMDFSGAMSDGTGYRPISKEYSPGIPDNVWEMAKVKGALPSTSTTTSVSSSSGSGGAGQAASGGRGASARPDFDKLLADQPEDDEELPTGCIEKSTHTSIMVSGKTKTTTVKTTYTYEDGSTQIKTTETKGPA